jgi:hypothetical protein
MGKKKKFVKVALPEEEPENDTILRMGNIFIPVSEKRTFFTCLCCGGLMRVLVAGNVIDARCSHKDGDDVKKCKNHWDKEECLGVESCERRNLVDQKSVEEMMAYLKSCIGSLLQIHDHVLLLKNAEVRKVVAQDYYTNDLYTVGEWTLDWITYIKIEINRAREKKIKALKTESVEREK